VCDSIGAVTRLLLAVAACSISIGATAFVFSILLGAYKKVFKL